MPQVHINGKWLSQPFTGVQRYSDELSRRIVAAEDVDFVLHVPKGALPPSWATMRRVVVRQAPVAGVIFEQLYLPVVTRGHLLVNFGGMAPVLKLRQLVTFHDATPFRFPQTYRRSFVSFYLFAYLVISRTARRVITVSKFSAQELAEILRVSPSRFLVVPCAADSLSDATAKEPNLLWQDGSYLLVGTLAQHKNLAVPARALAASGRRVVVAGAVGSAKVFSYASTPFGDNVVLAQHLTDAELRWLYEHARALVFPSFYEGFGLPVLEAQTLGCPVIASNRASIREVGGEGALYFDPSDPAELLRHADLLERDAVAAAHLVARGRRNAARFSWAKSGDQVLGAIRMFW